VFVSTALPQKSVFPKTEVNELNSLECRVHDSVNTERHSHGLKKLLWNESLADEARRHAANMAHRQFFSHTDPTRGDLAERLDRAGIAWNRCSENIYKEKGIRDPAADVVTAWMNSPGHRKNLMDLWMVEAGVGVAMQPDGTMLIVQAYIYPDP